MLHCVGVFLSIYLLVGTEVIWAIVSSTTTKIGMKKLHICNLYLESFIPICNVTTTHLPLPASSSSQSSQHTFPFLIHVLFFFFVNNPVNPISVALMCMHWCVAIHWSKGSLPGPHYWRKWFSVQDLSVSTAPVLGAGPCESLPDPMLES